MQKAYEYGVAGIVKYENGAIYIEAEGIEEPLTKFIAWCKKGPMGCKVSDFKIETGKIKDYKGFEMLKKDVDTDTGENLKRKKWLNWV